MRQPVRLAVVGAGLVGQRHISAICDLDDDIQLAAIVEPQEIFAPPAPVFTSIEQMFERVMPDGVILSTPTPLHVSGGFACVSRGVPVLIEKPLATSADEARQLTTTAAEREVPLLVGHHRRHNPLIRRAAELIKEGTIGELRAAQVTCWFYKPDDYFEIAPWRKKQGAGPISVNLVHDVDLMRYFMGEVVSVQAQMAPSRRGFENEDLAAALLRFDSGALCTITVSDSVVSPWSWELTSNEHPIYPNTNESCYLLGGSKGALSIPDMRLWHHEGGEDWWKPIKSRSTEHVPSDPLINQIIHFADVIRGLDTPLVSGEEGLRTLHVIEAIQQAAINQELITLTNSGAVEPKLAIQE
ncbi:MAG: Gfo/Idh/MocA family oxidoreductase [Pseudomonadota bacterium]